MSAVDASITALVTLLTMLFSISWQMTLVAILPLPFMAYATSRLGRKTHKAFGESQAAFSELNNKVQESVSGIKVTKSFGYQADELKSFQAVNELTFQKNLQTMKYDSLFDPMVLLFVGSSYVLTLFGWFLDGSGRAELRLVIWSPLSATWICWFGLLWLLVSSLILLSEGRFPTSGLRNFLSQKSPVQDPEFPLDSIENGRLQYAIDSFAFENEETLTNVHFSLEKGQTLGLVGQTGSGKTSLIKLLLREYDVDKGAIYLNGHNIRDYRLTDLRSLMGYVPQDQFLFATSILDNIRFGNPNLPLSAVEEATKLAQVYQDIVAMPQGFDTLIGEKGVSLSGGQKQRLAMSRAMILNPDILILDDSLSAVDAKTEFAIIDNLKETRKDKTTHHHCPSSQCSCPCRFDFGSAKWTNYRTGYTR